jgi:dienelactone hydrolase
MIRWLCAMALALGLSTLGIVAGAAPPLEIYGSLPGFEMAKLSPSGQRIAMIGVIGDERRLIVLEGEKLILTAAVGTQKVRGLHWAGDGTVLLKLSNTAMLGIGFTADKTEVSSMMVIDLASKATWPVFKGYAEVTGGISGFYGVIEREGHWYGYFGGITTGMGRDGERFFENGNPELYEVDFEKRKYRRIARRSDDEDTGRDWVIGPDGQVAATLDFFSKSGSWQIRNGTGTILIKGLARTGDISILGLGRTPGTILYLHGDEENGKRLFELSLAGGTAEEMLADISTSNFHFDPRSFQFIGYAREGDVPEDRFFDPRRDRMMAATRKAFPGLTVTLADWNESFDKFLVECSGPGEPDGWWLVDKKTGKAEPIGLGYAVAASDVGPMRMVPYKAADGLDMAGVLTLPPNRPAKNLPLVMLPHGGPHTRDYPVFDWWAQAFAVRGYAVFQPNFRGSTGLGHEFRSAGQGQWGRKMQTDISDGLAELAKQGIIDPKRACIVGASYGGYAALAGVTVQQGLYRCAVSVAGIGDIPKMLRDDIRESGGNDTLRRALKQDVGNGSDMQQVSPVTFADRADAPILLIHGKDDIVVPFSQSTDMLNALKRAGKPAELVTLAGEDHWLSKSATRLTMLKASVAFAEKHNPPDPAPAAK